jgi:N-methylhydantoinase B
VSETIREEPTLIRDLTPEEFEERYNCDLFTATVLTNRFQYIVQHMCSGLLSQAFSIILRDWYDFAATMSGPRKFDYPMPAVSNSLVVFLGTMAEAVRNSVEEFGHDELKPGDVLICNDSYRVGSHINDVCFIRPVFYDGSSEPVGFINLQAHMLDMGGVVPAGFSGTKKNIYENGLTISPRLLYREDKMDQTTFSLIDDNCRFGEVMLADFQSIYGNLQLGEHLLTETIDRYGLDAYLGAVNYSCDLSAEMMKAAIENVPDGDYEGEELLDCDGVDDSEEYHIRAKVKIRGGRAEIDLSGTSRQARTSINCGWLDAKTGCVGAMKYLLSPESAFTSGTSRDIDIVLPEGTVVSALPADGAIFLYFDSGNTVLLTVLRALAKALGENAIAGDHAVISTHNANGVTPDGTPWVTMAQCGGEHGPWGATKIGDADNYSVFYIANNLDPATEAIESDVPTVVLRKEYVTDSAGPGKNRGGAAVAKDTMWMTEAEQNSMPTHTKIPSGFGVYGGKDGATGGVWVWEPENFDVVKEQQFVDMTEEAYRKSTPVAGVLHPETYELDPEGEYFYFARVPIWQTEPHTVFRYITNGGGGWGDPLEREPERVLKDVRDEYVSIEGARRDYGVVVEGDPRQDPEGLVLDTSATEELRKEMRSGQV